MLYGLETAKSESYSEHCEKNDRSERGVPRLWQAAKVGSTRRFVGTGRRPLTVAIGPRQAIARLITHVICNGRLKLAFAVGCHPHNHRSLGDVVGHALLRALALAEMIRVGARLGKFRGTKVNLRSRIGRRFDCHRIPA